jgi:hypothetical protein
VFFELDIFPDGASVGSSGSIVSSSGVATLIMDNSVVAVDKLESCWRTIGETKHNQTLELMNSYHSQAQIDELTPLLNRVDRVDNAQTLPAISPVLARVSPQQEIPTNDLLPYPLSDQSTEMAFTLAVLLQLRHVEMQSFKAISAYERWFRTNLYTDNVETLEKQIIRVWTQFLDQYREVREVETVLWTQFPLEIGGSKTIRGLSIICPVLCRLSITFRSC